MEIRDRRGLKAAAKDALQAASYDPKKLILMHTGATVVLSLLIALLDYLLEQQIGGTGGLGGVGLRSVLETVQSVLYIGQMVAVLFWQIGYAYIALRISRREKVGPSGMLEGFRQFGPVLRLRLIVGLLYTGICLACVYVTSLIFTFTPFANPIMEAYQIGTEEALMTAVEECMLPLMGLITVVLLVVLMPCYYSLRMADFALMDHPREGAMMAIRKSRGIMCDNRFRLFRLDLSFWWFYVLEALVSLVAFGDMILPKFGVELPWSTTVSYYVFLVLCYVGQLVLYWWRGNEVQVTYAKAYEALMPQEAERETAL